MPSIHFKTSSYEERNEEEQGVLATPCPSCGVISSTRSIYINICCQEKYCLSCQTKNSHHTNACPATASECLYEYVERIGLFLNQFYNSADTFHPVNDETGRNDQSDNKYLFCQEQVSSLENKQVNTNYGILIKPRLVSIGEMEIKSHSDYERKRISDGTDFQYKSTSSKDKTKQTTFIFPRRKRIHSQEKENHPIKFMPAKLVRYMTADNFPGMSQIIVNSSISKHKPEYPLWNEKDVTKISDQDLHDRFVRKFSPGTIYPSVYGARSKLSMFGNRYRFRMFKRSCHFLCCEEKDCSFRVSFTHIFRVARQRVNSKGKKSLKGLDDHPIMITKAILRHSHPVYGDTDFDDSKPYYFTTYDL